MDQAIIYKSTDGTQYSITAPDGTEGDAFDYGDVALVRDESGDIFLCEMDGPLDEPKIERVTDTETIRCESVEIDFGPEEGEPIPIDGAGAN